MTAGARSLSLEETLLEPPALPPPPTRHALFVILIALAALLHVATIGSGDLYSQTEGQYAGAAREMVEEFIQGNGASKRADWSRFFDVTDVQADAAR